MTRMKRLLLACTAAMLLSVSLTAGVEARPPTLSISPATVTLGSTFELSGCGYPAPTSISFHVVGPTVDYFTAGEPLTDASGCFEDVWLAWWADPGKYSITSYYRDSKGSTKKATVVKFTAEAAPSGG